MKEFMLLLLLLIWEDTRQVKVVYAVCSPNTVADHFCIDIVLHFLMSKVKVPQFSSLVSNFTSKL